MDKKKYRIENNGMLNMKKGEYLENKTNKWQWNKTRKWKNTDIKTCNKHADPHVLSSHVNQMKRFATSTLYRPSLERIQTK